MKKMMEELGIKPGPIVRRALEEEIRRKLLERLEGRVKELAKTLQGIPDEEIARLIREDRGR
ncbi:hypothetical protein IG193_07280 [Infirmifilum lucidum]|uniref:Uncharacterized protein n=2 Tax=Infirmifilum lucidum TaxID=2776706 RepID=A0A7L9FL98_9CREN|nr:hypothetical protein IG193_07280 [Infirmifilum lucidum]